MNNISDVQFQNDQNAAHRIYSKQSEVAQYHSVLRYLTFDYVQSVAVCKHKNLSWKKNMLHTEEKTLHLIKPSQTFVLPSAKDHQRFKVIDNYDSRIHKALMLPKRTQRLNYYHPSKLNHHIAVAYASDRKSFGNVGYKYNFTVKDLKDCQKHGAKAVFAKKAYAFYNSKKPGHRYLNAFDKNNLKYYYAMTAGKAVNRKAVMMPHGTNIYQNRDFMKQHNPDIDDTKKLTEKQQDAIRHNVAWADAHHLSADYRYRPMFTSQQKLRQKQSIDWNKTPIVDTGTVKLTNKPAGQPQNLSSGTREQKPYQPQQNSQSAKLMRYNYKMHQILGLPQHAWIHYYRANQHTPYPILSFTSTYPTGYGHHSKGIKYNFTANDIRECEKFGPEKVFARKAYNYIRIGGSYDLRDKFDACNVHNFMKPRLERQRRQQAKLMRIRKIKYSKARATAAVQGKQEIRRQRAATRKRAKTILRHAPKSMRSVVRDIQHNKQQLYHNNFYRSQLHQNPSKQKQDISFNGAYIMMQKGGTHYYNEDRLIFAVSIKPVVHTARGDKYLINKRLPDGKPNHFLTMPYAKFHRILAESGNQRYMLRNSRARREGVSCARQKLFYSTPVLDKKTGKRYLRPSIPLNDRVSLRAPITDLNTIDERGVEPAQQNQSRPVNAYGQNHKPAYHYTKQTGGLNAPGF